MAGFGASIAWYENNLVIHPNKQDIYYYIFSELGLDILRLRNTYRYGILTSSQQFAEIVQNFYTLSEDEPIVEISSWSPPANLKNNNNTNNGGTLKMVNGEYVYGDFARYWVDALNAYKAVGIEPAWIGIQNEPSFRVEWESCVLQPTQNASFAGYDRALDSVYFAVQQLATPPKILGPEVLGIGYNLFQNYAQRFNHDHLEAYAYHLYHGESDNINDNHNPDLFIPNLTTIANTYPGKPIWQTEYDRGDWFKTVWLIHNCLVYGNVSAYLFWELVWVPGGNPLVVLQPDGYEITKYYWAFRQYAKFISAGWRRVTAESGSNNLRISAFINPDGSRLSVVIVNVGTQNEQMSLDIQNFAVTSGMVVRTSETEDGEEITNSYDGAAAIDYSARSITTLAFTGTLTGVSNDELTTPAGFALSQNYPNPFNPTTTIHYYLDRPSSVKLTIWNATGEEIKTLKNTYQPAGNYSLVWDATDEKNHPVATGIYFYSLHTENLILQKKMLLLR